MCPEGVLTDLCTGPERERNRGAQVCRRRRALAGKLQEVRPALGSDLGPHSESRHDAHVRSDSVRCIVQRARGSSFSFFFPSSGPSLSRTPGQAPARPFQRGLNQRGDRWRGSRNQGCKGGDAPARPQSLTYFSIKSSVTPGTRLTHFCMQNLWTKTRNVGRARGRCHEQMQQSRRTNRETQGTGTSRADTAQAPFTPAASLSQWQGHCPTMLVSAGP